MKAKLLTDRTCVPGEEFPGDWECSSCPAHGRGARLTRCPKCGERVRQKDGIKPAGTVIEHPLAYIQVRNGTAVPADEECRRRANMTPEQMEAAAYAYERTSKGIHPDDFRAYAAGEMTGYDKAGNLIPGPAFTGEDEEEVVEIEEE